MAIGETAEDAHREPWEVRLQRANEVARAIQRAIAQCRNSCPHRATEVSVGDPPPPFAESRVPYDTVIEIIERMSVEGLSLYQAADEYGYPAEAIEMELARARGNYNRELLRRSGWRWSVDSG